MSGLTTKLLVLAGSILGPFVLGRTASVVIPESAGPDDSGLRRWYGRVETSSLLVGPLLAIVVASGLSATVGATGGLAAIGDTVVGASVAVASVSALSLGQRPLLERRRDPALTVPAAFRRRWWTAVCVPIGAFAVTYTLLTASDVLSAAWLLAIGVVCVGLLAWLLLPFGPYREVTASVRTPSDDERARIERCFERFGGDPGWLQVFDTDRTPSTYGMVNGSGRGALTSVWIHEEALASWSDDQLAVALAYVDASNRRGNWTVRTAWYVLYGLFGTFVLYLIGGWLPFDTVMWGLLALMGALLVIPWLVRRRVYDCDAVVADHFDAETIRAVYDSVGRSINRHPERSDNVDGVPLLSWFRPDPTFDRRLAAMLAESDDDPRGGD